MIVGSVIHVPEKKEDENDHHDDDAGAAEEDRGLTWSRKLFLIEDLIEEG